MLKVIIGVKGTGKTKILVDMVNKASAESKGCVLCVEKGTNLRSDVNFRTRLINSDDYMISDADALYGFFAGMLASNFDVTDIFLDAVKRIVNGNVESLDGLFTKLDTLSGKYNTNIVVTLSIPKEEASSVVKKYLIN